MADRSGYIGRAPGDSSVIISRQTFEPTGIQTDFTFSAGYTPGYIDVYLNGSRLIVASDYTAVDGSVVGLTTNAISGDVLELVAYKAFNLANVNSTPGNFTVGGDLTVSGTTTLGTVAAGASVSYATTSFGLSGSPNIAVNNITGVAVTFSGDVDANAGLDVDGHTELDNLNVAGVSTFQGNVNTGANVYVGAAISMYASSGIVSATSFYGDNLNVGTGVTVYGSTGIVSATAFYGDGQYLDNVSASGGGETDITSCLFI